MRKNLLIISICVIASYQGSSQGYLRPVIVQESSPGAGDGSITLIPYNLTAPYSITWGETGTWRPTDGLILENARLGVRYRCETYDNNCKRALFSMGFNPATSIQMSLDTIIITMPTPGNDDGSIEFRINNVPSDGVRVFGSNGGGGPTTDSVFTGLEEGFYTYSIQFFGGTGEVGFTIGVSLYNTITPCKPYATRVRTEPAINTLTFDDCDEFIYPDVPECDGSVSFISHGQDPVYYGYTVAYQMSGATFNVTPVDAIITSVDSLCSGAYNMYTSSDFFDTGNNYSTSKNFYISDENDSTYIWNELGMDPENTDLYLFDALERPAINYAGIIDTVYIDDLEELTLGQYHIKTAIVQNTDTFYLYHTEYLNCAQNYLFDISVFEGDSLLCASPSAMRHLVYFEWPVNTVCPGDTMVLGSAMYLKPIITSESAPGACDASITVIPYGGTPPYSVEWNDENTWHPSSGLTANDLCAGEEISVSLTDANCMRFETTVKIAPNPADQIALDTVIVTYPTPGYANGNYQVFFENIPAGSSKKWFFQNGEAPTNSTLFTDLFEGYYGYSISNEVADVSMKVGIPIYSGPLLPCDPFKTYTTLQPLSSFLERSSECMPVEPPQPNSGEDPSFVCNGYFTLFSEGASEDFFDTAYYKITSEEQIIYVDNITHQSDTTACRGPYTIYSFNNSVSGNNYFNVSSIFITDSLDTYYEWNKPDTIPQNTDTLIVDALNRPRINYGLDADTAYIHSVNVLDDGQYEITTAVVQDLVVFYLHTTEYLDTSRNYIFDITVFEGDSLLCAGANMHRHLIYFEWPEIEEPCDSVYICHVPPGNPGAAHTILIPCEDVGDHIGNHSLDYMGPCYENGVALAPNNMQNGNTQKQIQSTQVKTLRVFPNPFEQRLQVSSSDMMQSVEIYSFDGKQIFTQPVRANQVNLDVKSLVPSTYFIKVYYTDGAMEMRKLVKLK